MKKAAALILLVFLAMPAFAQWDDDDIPFDPEWDIFITEVYARGDQTFMIALGLTFPTLFMNQGNRLPNNLNLGGTGTLTYMFFLDSRISVGGTLGLMFNSTIGENMVFMIPLGIRTSYQLLFGRFEFPLHVTLGVNWHRYLDFTYFGYFMQFGTGAFFRFGPDWSFGVDTSWGWHPQWTGSRRTTVHGNFVNLLFAARFHF